MKNLKRYPENLPKIPIYNNLETCVNCNMVWIDPCSGGPDCNHCVPMVSEEYSLDTLSAEQKKRYLSIVGAVQCPLYEPKSDNGPVKI
jgi:hypothetical protein